MFALCKIVADDFLKFKKKKKKQKKNQRKKDLAFQVNHLSSMKSQALPVFSLKIKKINK